MLIDAGFAEVRARLIERQRIIWAKGFARRQRKVSEQTIDAIRAVGDDRAEGIDAAIGDLLAERPYGRQLKPGGTG